MPTLFIYEDMKVCLKNKIMFGIISFTLPLLLLRKHAFIKVNASLFS